jgi:hypothetical protein
MIPVIYPNYYPEQINYNKRNNVVAIVTTKVGTFSSTWKGSGTLYFDPGDGGDIEPLVLTAGGVAWNHDYPSVGSKTIRITGDLDGVTWIAMDHCEIVSPINNIVKHMSTALNRFRIAYNNGATGDIACLKKFENLDYLLLEFNTAITGDISNLFLMDNLNTCYLASTSLSFASTANTPPWDGFYYNFRSALSKSLEIGNLLISAANGGVNNCIIYLDGTCPAPPATQEVTDAIATLAGNGVTLYVST